MLKRLNIALVLLLMGFSTLGSAAPRVLVIGDSLSAAFGIEQHTGWVQLLQQRLRNRGYPHQVVNASISGETSSGGLVRIGEVLRQHKPAIVIIALGINDGLRGLSLSTMKQNLGSMVKQAQAVEAQVLLIGMQLPPNYGPVYNRRFQQIFSQLAEQFDTAFLPFLLQGIGEERALFLSDGLHPNAEAQPLILDTVWKALRRLLPLAVASQGSSRRTCSSPFTLTPECTSPAPMKHLVRTVPVTDQPRPHPAQARPAQQVVP